MKKVSILALDDVAATTITGPFDAFYQAGVRWNLIFGLTPSPCFDVEILSMSGKEIVCRGGFTIQPHGAMHQVENTDLIVVTAPADFEKQVDEAADPAAWLKRRHREGAKIAGVCTGAFLLAETGLLDGKAATTHWGFIERFRRRYPRIKTKPEKIITDEGDLFCSGGLTSGIDLSLYLVERYFGHEIAVQVSKTIVHDLGRDHQAPYSVFQLQKNHGDLKIASIQEWIEDHYAENFDYDALAAEHGVSRRTLERRFKAATGDTPMIYRQRLRVEAAKRLLENGDKTFDEISYHVGYEDSGFFRKIFSRHTELRPKEYRKLFRRC